LSVILKSANSEIYFETPEDPLAGVVDVNDG